MAPYYHCKIGAAGEIPVPDPTPVLSFSPVVLPSPDRPVDLQIRVSAPQSGSNLPIILLSHGLGFSHWISSHFAYTPLSDFWASRGFVVIQPTHLDSHFLGLEKKDASWESRAKDMVQILDQIDEIEKSVPTLEGRLNKDKIAIAGHSMGAFTAGLLLGANNKDPRDGKITKQADPRIKVGVILAGSGVGEDVAEGFKSMLPYYGPQFDTMTTPALVVYGDEDNLPLTTRGADWFTDPYKLSPSPKALLAIKGAKHGLGGVGTWNTADSENETPERLGTVQKMTWAYLWSQLYGDGGDAWGKAVEAMRGLGQLGSIEIK